MAFFLEGFVAHRFYLGQTGLNFFYLLFCWTLIPAVIALVDFIAFLTMSKENFDLKYNPVYFSQPITHNYVPISPITPKDAATEIERLHGAYTFIFMVCFANTRIQIAAQRIINLPCHPINTSGPRFPSFPGR